MESAESQGLASVAIGKQSEMTDLDEAGWQDMKQEATDELDCVECHNAAAVAMAGVSPAESNLSVVKAE